MNKTNSSAEIHDQAHPQTPPSPPPQRKAASRSESNRVLSIQQMVKEAHARKASDIHIRVGLPPRYRVRGEMFVAEGHGKTTPEIFAAYLSEILTPAQKRQFSETKELDTAIFYPGFLRCRVNCFDSLTGGAIVMRLISLDVPSIDTLGLPQVLKQIVSKPQGLVLVTGPTGSGKSTTIAAMIRYLNETAHKHIVTIEDPIEYVHPSHKCLISQREVGLHTHEFLQALRSVLREDPDVILIGEMRDRITINTALQAAQTGHLVLGTLHTRSAVNAVNRLLNLYNPDEQHTMRIQMVESLVAIVAQLLLPTTDKHRLAVHDVLINTLAVQDYLMKGEDEEVLRLMETDTMEGMQLMNQALYEQLLMGRLTIDDARKASPDPNDLERKLRTGGIDGASSSREWMMNK
ncbi:MAG: PilT/PilU family type 4a pilus ATPase [Kastovskya adunca ATA6-11-RM4]|jgi:twitching motility protein PilT|nr:PilT/PilU family type 4a pilus ATPase [Kastovskya adunca ATA6-11-RM4]